MTYFITALGIFYIIAGAVFFMRPEYVRAIIEFFKIGKRIYISGGARLFIGVLLVFAAQSALVPWIPRIIGILALLGGAVIFALGVSRMGAWLNWWKGLADNKLRIIAVIAGIIGILLIYSS